MTKNVAACEHEISLVTDIEYITLTVTVNHTDFRKVSIECLHGCSDFHFARMLLLILIHSEAGCSSVRTTLDHTDESVILSRKVEFLLKIDNLLRSKEPLDIHLVDLCHLRSLLGICKTLESL